MRGARRTMLLLAFAACAGLPAAARGQSQSALPGAEVVVINRVTREQLAGTADIRLGTRLVTLQPGDSIAALLRASGFVPNGDAIAAVYRLNGWSSAPDLDGMTTIRMPTLEASDAVHARLARGHAAWITVDVSTKLEFLDRVIGLPSLVEQIRVPSTQQLHPRQQLRNVATLVNERSRAIGLAIQEATRPADAELVDVLNAELGRFTSLVQAVVAADRDPTSEELAVAAAIASDFELKGEYWRDTFSAAARMEPYPRVPVRVHTVDAAGAPVRGLRVYRQVQGLYGYRNPEPILELTSPAPDSLHEANYVIFAARADDPQRRPVTPVLTDVLVRRRCTNDVATRTPDACHLPIQLTVIAP